jgi:hypothetical protein
MASAQGIANVFNPSCVPSTDEEKELLVEQQKFGRKVLEQTMETWGDGCNWQTFPNQEQWCCFTGCKHRHKQQQKKKQMLQGAHCFYLLREQQHAPVKEFSNPKLN